MFVPKCLTLMLLMLHATDVFGRKKPEMRPGLTEIHLNEGERLEIACYGSAPIDFYYPNANTEFITTSPVEINEYSSSRGHQTNLVREKTVHGDTGYYGCAENDVDVTPGIYDEPDVTWTYVYVKSTENGFVSRNDFDFLYPIVGGSVVLPCRPNSPDYQVKLMVNYEETEMNEKFSFNPRIGFTVKNLVLMDSGSYRCEIERGDDIDGADYHLRVESAPILVAPRIAEEPLRHVILGQTLRVNCSTDVSSDQHFSLNWTTPHPSPRISINTYSKAITGASEEAISELVIRDVSQEDAGEYTCTVYGTHDKRETKKNITVHDPNNTYMKLKPAHDNMFYNAAEGDEVTWVISIDAFPQPDLQWYFIHDGVKPEHLKNSSRHQIINKADQMVLKLKKLKVTDMGIYSLQATNDYGVETLNFTLEVTSHPLVEDFIVQPYYLPNVGVKIDCHAVAFPPPNITWSFVPLEGGDIIILKNATHESESAKTISTVTLMTNTSGSLNCSSCNIHGCDSVVQMIFVSDVRDGFGIIPPEQKDVTAGDDLILTCAASIYNYTDAIHWFDENGVEIMENERIHINRTRSPFTYQSILHIDPVEKSDQQTYTCRGIFEPNEEENLDYFLEVHDPLAPYFLNDTNLNETENIYSPGIDSVQNLALKCYVKGMPEPRITWLKDDVPINFDDETAQKDYTLVNKNQELYIEQLLERLSGKYTCRAENAVGKIESFQKITVKGKEVPQWLTSVIIFLVVLLVILVIFFSFKVHRERVMRKQLMEAGLTHFEEGALECLNPDLTVDDQAELLPYDKKWEFPRERLKFGKQLGHGAFGVVMKAEAHGIVEGEESTTVAVKMVKRSTESIHIRALASELKIMVHLGKHLNVVNLLGACTKNIAKRELLVIVEYCRYGNLHNYLLRHRGEFINQIDPATGKIDLSIGSDLLKRSVSVSSHNSLSTSSGNGDSNGGPYSPGPDSQGVSMSPDGMIMSNNSIQPGWRSNYRGDYKDQNLKPICTQDLLSWAFQVARGMEYLSQRKVLHGDLAARNILLAENNIVKICDFGLAKTMYKDDNYKKKGDAPLPIKWMAIESIRDRVFSTQSDIWSFGIVLWEFFTLAKTPYPGMEAEKQYQRLVEGYRMEKPEFATEQIYDIMFQCWKAKPTLRPTFSELVENIGCLLDDNVKMHYVDLNTPYMDMNTMIKNDYLTMMSAPDHDALSSPTRDYVNTPCLPQSHNDASYICMSPSGRTDESDIFSPRMTAEKSHFEFPTPKMSAIQSDSDSEAVELSPMLKNSMDDDPYLKPINVQERRAEFSKQRQALKARDSNGERDSGYCNTPHNIKMFDIDNEIKDEIDTTRAKLKKDYITTPGIIRTQDNYVNMPKNKTDYKKETPDSFTNPSYVLIDKNFPQTEV